jgi:hypothetical protein
VVERAPHAILTFLEQNKKETKKNSVKILLFVFRINESVEYLLAVRRHRTPWGPRAVVMFAIYTFAIFYPASVLYETGFEFHEWNLYLMTGLKLLILISLYNVQALMEDPFNQASPDGIRLDDFRFKRDSLAPVPVNRNAPGLSISNML